MNRLLLIAAIAVLTDNSSSCAPDKTSNDVQRDAQNKILSEGTSAVGMPAIHNFRERRQLKDIYEMRDQEGLITYTYLYNEMQGKLVFLCGSIGYGIPAATQYTAPETMQTYNLDGAGSGNRFYGAERMSQADPNGLFSPPSAEGTWVTCLGPDKQQHPVYVEPRVIVSPFKLTE